MAFKPFSIDSKSKHFSFECSCCGNVHSGGPSFAMDMPHEAFAVPEEEFNERIKLNSDLCVVDGNSFYIRATLSIPIQNSSEDFLWGVWVTQSEESFDRYVKTFDADQSNDESFGWLPITFPGYAASGAEVRSSKTSVFWGRSDEKPSVVFHNEECHQMAVDQRDGISWDRAVELAMLTLHPDGKPS